MITTITGQPISKELLENYFKSLVNSFFKILPIKESGEESLTVYMQSLQLELLGCQELITELNDDAGFMTLVSILQYLISNPDCAVGVVRREVFKAISICNKLKARYAEGA